MAETCVTLSVATQGKGCCQQAIGQDSFYE